jgi:phosphopantetheine adenylyltransferase
MARDEETDCRRHWYVSISPCDKQNHIAQLGTDDKLLTKKSNREFLESIQTRMEKVRDFLKLFKPEIEYDVTPIQDVYGPTGWDPDVQALVVSIETLSGSASSKS